ncbi:MAG: c-type cytochrome [Flavobacteriaceae bacterium]|nr:c-type cytochrome [Flavobacteriaceae bacterium]
MKKNKNLPILRVLIIFVVYFIIAESMAGGLSNPSFLTESVMLSLHITVLLTLIIVEAFIEYSDRTDWNNMNVEERTQYIIDQKQSGSLKAMYRNWTKAKPIEEESSILLNHDFDGIQELDNVLPPWWVQSFYITIVFAIGYMCYYHFMGGATQEDEYQAQLEEAKVQMEWYKKNAKNLIDADNVTFLDSDEDLAIGQEIFEMNCAACHKPDGGGSIGPNLTDKYWLLGGGIKNIFTTITEGGRDGKGMIPWKATLNSLERQRVASYIMYLEGSEPEGAKKAEGDIWE